MIKHYGLPYKGSKNKIVKELVDILPVRDNLYDLFCGGGAVIHRCIEVNKYKHYYANDLNKLSIQGLEKAFKGEYKNETRWISREDFFKLRDSDFYVSSCFSFGNNGASYCYGEHIEPWKKAFHYARVFNDYSLLAEFGIITDKADRMTVKEHEKEWKEKYINWYCRTHNIDREKAKQEIERIKANKDKDSEEIRLYLVEALKKSELSQAEVGRRLGTQMAGHYFGKSEWSLPTEEYYIKMQEFLPLNKDYKELAKTLYGEYESLESLESLQSLESLESLERLERLQSLESLQSDNITFSNLDYSQVEIKDNSVIYCDIPYIEDKKPYRINGEICHFDYERFYSWCLKQTQPLLISSYTMPTDRFVECFSKDRISIASPDSRAIVTEKLFYPITQKDLFEKQEKVEIIMEEKKQEEIKTNTEEKKENKLNEYVKLIGHYGDDNTICEAARMSFNKDREYTQEENEALLKRMIENGHSSPFEQVNFTFKLHMPIFIARQWMRHRTAKMNEQSARYTQLNNEFFKLNKDNLRSNKEISEGSKEYILEKLEDYYSTSWSLYSRLIDLGVVKEQARTVLPLSIYTTFIWQMDLHNLMHFLELRLGKSAQLEIQEYAREILRQVREYCPLTIKLFESYRLCQN